MRGLALTAPALLLCVLAAACAVKPPLGKRPTPRAFTAQPDPQIPCTCAIEPKTLRFTATPPIGLCGSSMTGASPTTALSCGTLYLGGGGASARAGVLPDVDAVFRAAACNDRTVFLRGATQKQAGQFGTCTAKGCPFGAPAPFPDATNTPASTCVVLKVADDPVGEASCATGDAAVSVPLIAEIYLTGDFAPRASGIQACPVCTGPAGRRTCKGGARNGKRCMPGGPSLVSEQPTSTDCPPDAKDLAGTVSLPLVLDTQPQAATASALPKPSTQGRVFCGFCRDVDGTGAFEGTTSRMTRPCATSGDCAQPFEACEQRTSGAFGRGDMASIGVTGATAAGLADGKPHPATLASLFCVPPTFDATLDASFDLPGPGAMTLPGMLQLQ